MDLGEQFRADAQAGAETGKRPAFQFSLRAMLVVMFIVAVACGLLVMQQYLLAFGWFVLLAVAGMTAGIVRGRPNQKGAALLLAAAIVYAVVNWLLFQMALSGDPFSIFDMQFMFIAVLGGPLTAMAVVVSVAVVSRRLDWLVVAGFVLWMACVGFANLAVIGMASASV